MQTWKCGNHPTCHWPDNCPTGAQPPQPRPITKWQANIFAEMPITVLQKRRPTTYPCRPTVCQAHWTSSASLPCFQHRKGCMHSWHDHDWFFLLCCYCEHTVTFENEPFKLLKVQFYQDKAVPTQSSKLLHMAAFLTLTFYTYKKGINDKRIGHSHSTSATLCPIVVVVHQVAHVNLHKAKPHQQLRCSYCTVSKTYHYLASQDIMQVLHASALYDPCFCVNPASVECCSLCTSSAVALFSCRVNALLIKLVGCWHSDVILCYLYVQSCPIISGLSKLMLAGGNPQLLMETTTMPLHNPSLFVG